MPISALTPQRLHDQIAGELIKLVINGDYPPGSRLPPERELAESLGVSRGSLRQALVALEVSGIFQIRVSNGVFVADGAVSIANRLPALPDDFPPLEIIKARRAVEGETAMLAAQHATDANLAEIEAAAASLEHGQRRYDLRHPSDRAFHLKIAASCGNGALEALVHNLWDMQRGRLYQRLEDHFSTAPMRDLAIADHERIVEALRRRDPEQAQRAMHHHLDRVYINLATSALDGHPQDQNSSDQ